MVMSSLKQTTFSSLLRTRSCDRRCQVGGGLPPVLLSLSRLSLGQLFYSCCCRYGASRFLALSLEISGAQRLITPPRDHRIS